MFTQEQLILYISTFAIAFSCGFIIPLIFINYYDNRNKKFTKNIVESITGKQVIEPKEYKKPLIKRLKSAAKELSGAKYAAYKPNKDEVKLFDGHVPPQFGEGKKEHDKGGYEQCFNFKP